MKRATVLTFGMIAAAILLLAIANFGPGGVSTPVQAQTAFVVTNNTGETAGFLHLQSNPSFFALPSVQPVACGTGTISKGFEYWEVTWPGPCVAPGESVTFDVPTNLNVFSHYWAPSIPVVSAVNDTGVPAFGLTIKPGGFIKGALLVQNAPGCSTPGMSFSTSGQVALTWTSACVDPGEKVSVHVGMLNPVTSAPYNWDASVGGISRGADVAALALETSNPATLSREVTLGIAAAVSLAALFVSGVAWYARRHRVR